MNTYPVRPALESESTQIKGLINLVGINPTGLDWKRFIVAVNAEGRSNVFPISAVTGEGIDTLLAAISRAFDEEKSERTLTLGFTEGRKRAWLHAEGVVIAEEDTEDGHRMTVRWTARQEKRYREL